MTFEPFLFILGQDWQILASASMVLRSSVGLQIIRDVIKPKFDLVSVFIPTETRRLQILSPLFLSRFF